MHNLRTVSRAILIPIGLFGFLFGQVFNAHFSLAATTAGLFGCAVAVLSREDKLLLRDYQLRILACAALALIGVAGDVLAYYGSNPSSGNYYPWFLVAPFVGSLLFLAYQFRPRGSRSMDADS